MDRARETRGDLRSIPPLHSCPLAMYFYFYFFSDRPSMPIVLSPVNDIRRAHPTQDLSMLIGVLEQYVEAERGDP